MLCAFSPSAALSLMSAGLSTCCNRPRPALLPLLSAASFAPRSSAAYSIAARPHKAGQRADDEAFGTLWLELMIAHHEGAVEMAQAQQATGTFRPAVELAEEIEA